VAIFAGNNSRISSLMSCQRSGLWKNIENIGFYRQNYIASVLVLIKHLLIWAVESKLLEEIAVLTALQQNVD